ncbi:MAG TPA: 5-deoxy-glucuronate isomerase [Roseiflexaceae bacterium]|nr:5-deoxy-glucuronate isomerase [Roseiflexaceae bacterium]
MRQYDTHNLIVHPGGSADPGVVVEVTPERAGWDYIHFQVRRLPAGGAWSFATGEHELALVSLGGALDVVSDRGSWRGVGGRPHVFAGLPHALYLPRRTALTVRALADAEFAVAWALTDRDDAPRLVTPDEVAVEIRGGDNATRQINSIIPPGFPCRRLVVVEVYTPGGSWSSYPPHKHDVHRTDGSGTLLEADLEEIYYYKFDKPEGYAFQRVYTGPDSPLQRAGHPIDALLLAREDDVVLVPEGYHPVASAPGYTAYYLNVLAGSAQSLANSDDPRYAWVKESYTARDPRVPVYPVGTR